MLSDTDKKRLDKFCDSCGKFLSTEKFCWLPSVQRYHNYCRECDKAHKREWYINNKSRCDEKRKKWQDENHDRHIEHVKKYCKSEKGKENHKRWIEKNREKNVKKCN